MTGFNYIITARARNPDGSFSDRPGRSTYLRVPKGRDTYTFADQVPLAQWTKEIMALSDPHKDNTGIERGDVLVFIHGYNNSMRDILKRHDRLCQDLPDHQFKGAIVSFDWPCNDVALAYLPDRLNAKMTALQLVTDCIRPLASMQAKGNCTLNVHLLAHSTGAFVIREAFDDADDRDAIASVNWTVSQVVLIAGDVSSASLSADDSEARSLYRHCVRLTNYSNGNDTVLQLSNVKRVGISPRVGRVGLPALAPSNAVNIDCSEYYEAVVESRPEAEILGNRTHSWHIGDPLFTEDLALTLRGGLDRTAIKTRTSLPRGGLKLGRAGS